MNREDQLMELATGEKYGIVKQFTEEDGTYLFAARLDDAEENLTGEFALFKESEENGQIIVEQITDEEKIKSLKLDMGDLNQE